VTAGTRRIRVFTSSSDSVVATRVNLDTSFTFDAGTNRTLYLFGFARSTAAPRLRGLITTDNVPTIPAGQFAVRVVNLAPSLAGAVPTLADTTVRTDAFVRRLGVLPGVGPEAVNLGPLDVSQYVVLDTGRYALTVTATGTTGPAVLAVPVIPGAAATPTATALAGSLAPGTALTAVIIPRSVIGSAAPQGGNPTAKATEAITRSNDTVTVQSGSISVLTNRSPTRPDSTVGTTGTGAATGVSRGDAVFVSGATQPEYNGWQAVMQIADSLSCNPVNGGDTPTRCAATNTVATTRFRYRYRVAGTPTSPATGTPAYRIYPPGTATNFTIPFVMFLVDRRP
jgi:hypothetical protein